MVDNFRDAESFKYYGIKQNKMLLMMKFVGELRKNNYPNASSFQKLLAKDEIKKTPRTIQRWIDELKSTYKAPIEYDYSQRGYYLSDPNWDFEVPDFDGNVLSSVMLSTQLASAILPPVLKQQVNDAMTQALCNGESNELDDAVIDSFISKSHIIAAVDSEIFKKVFFAWSNHQVFEMSYQKPDGSTKNYVIEPHIIAFNGGKWYIKGYEYNVKEKLPKCYAIQRIRSIGKFVDTFETDKDLVNRTNKFGLFDFEKMENVKIYCEPSIVFYLLEHKKNMGYQIDINADGSAVMTIPPAPKHEIIRYVLGESGLLTVLEPASLRAEIAEISRKLADNHK